MLLLAALVWWWRGGPETGREPAEAVPVRTVSVTTERFPIYLEGLGTVQASNTVRVIARVDGMVREVAFDEGQFVDPSDVLFRIDPTLYEAKLRQAEAALDQHEAQLDNAEAELERLKQVKKYASLSAVEAQEAQVAQIEANIEADEAAIDQAMTELEYTEIHSPISGRTGLRQVDVGNIVHAVDKTPLVTVTQLRPAALLFSLNADQLPLIQRAMQERRLPVLAYGRDNRTLLAQGELTLYDNRIDPATGMVKLKARFANEDLALWPGQFVNVRLQIEVQEAGITLPTAAIRQGPSGAFVWLVEDGGTVRMQPVRVYADRDGRALVSEGLSSGQEVVVEGHFRLKPGSRVRVLDAPGAGETASADPA